MTRSIVLAAGAASVALLVAMPAQARPRVWHLHGHEHVALAPISLRHAQAASIYGPRWPKAEPQLLPRRSSRPGFGLRQVGPFSGERAQLVPRSEYGLVGAGALPFGVQTTRWGTADSATTGGTYPLPSSRYRAEVPLQMTSGEPFAVRSLGRYGSGYGYPPTGELGYYNSGSPGGMAYYGSSSSAGPGGTPGGLAIYSSGSYGPGPEILYVGQHRVWHRLVPRGPHIIHVGRD